MFPKCDLQRSWANANMLRKTRLKNVQNYVMEAHSCTPQFVHFESAEFDTRAHRESGYPVVAGSPPVSPNGLTCSIVFLEESSWIFLKEIARSVILRYPYVPVRQFFMILRDPPWSSCLFHDVSWCSETFQGSDTWSWQVHQDPRIAPCSYGPGSVGCHITGYVSGVKGWLSQ